VRIVLQGLERGWEILGLAIPTATSFLGNLLVACERRKRAAGVAARRTEPSGGFEEIESSYGTAKRSGFGAWAGEILVYDNEHSEKYLPDPDFMKLVSSDWLHLFIAGIEVVSAEGIESALKRKFNDMQVGG
jgi:hypothetical protein